MSLGKVIDITLLGQFARAEVVPLKGAISSVAAAVGVVDDGLGESEENLAERYGESASYAAGDYCVCGHSLYKAKEAVTVVVVEGNPVFDPTKWDKVCVMDLVSSGGVTSSVTDGILTVG